MTTITGFILAAGEGRRLRPLTLSRPKALVPLLGVPLLDLAVDQVRSLPLNALVVNAWHRADEVAAAVQRRMCDVSVPVYVSREKRLLDTGGGLREGVRLAPASDHILVHNVDVILDADLRELLQSHLATGAAATVVLVPTRGPLTVDMAPDGCIREFRRRPGQGGYTFAGVHLLQRRVLELLPEREVCSIIEAYEAALAAGMDIRGVPLAAASAWADLGTCRSYLQAHAEFAVREILHHRRLGEAQAEQRRRRAALRDTGVTCSGVVGLGADIFVSAGAHLHNVVVWDGACVRQPACFSEGVLPGGEIRLSPVTETRQPDPRVFASLGMDPARCERVDLAKRGSGRAYARLISGDRSWIWCVYSPERRENGAYAAHAEFLRGLGVRVPEIFLHLPDCGETVFADLGEVDLLQLQGGAQVDSLLQAAEQAARLHVLGGRVQQVDELPLQQPFDEALYRWECDYFREHMLGAVLQAPPQHWAAVEREVHALRDLLLAQPMVPVHRDLQSTNVMVHNGMTYLIDFQGLRLGCAAYDVASLIYDPYTCYPRPVRDRAWRHYTQCVRALDGQAMPEGVLQAAAIQRLLQALGAYGKLWLTDGLERYRQHILPGFTMLEAAAAESRRFPAFLSLARECRHLAGLRLGARD